VAALFTKFDPQAFLESEKRQAVPAKVAKVAKVEKVERGQVPTLAGLASLADPHTVFRNSISPPATLPRRHLAPAAGVRPAGTGRDRAGPAPQPTAARRRPQNSQTFAGLFRILDILASCCPEYVPVDRWQRAVEDGVRFLAQWGGPAAALGWTARDLFALHQQPAKPHPSYNRLSRYDCTGLVWLLGGRPVVALTVATAAIQGPTGAVTVYRRHSKPALGPRGDSLDDRSMGRR